MADLSEHYREMAAGARAKADLASLENVKTIHLRSAERLEEMAEAVEFVAQAKDRNDAAKAQAAS